MKNLWSRGLALALLFGAGLCGGCAQSRGLSKHQSTDHGSPETTGAGVLAVQLTRTAPERAGFAAGMEDSVRSHLESCIESRVFPGAVVLVALGAEVVLEMAVGHETYDDHGSPMGLESLFDLASLTKVCATTPAVLRLVDAGRLDLDATVQSVLPEFRGPGKEAVTMRHLLTHTGGLVSYVRFWRTVQVPAGENLRDAILRAAAAEGLRTEPGTSARYSDVGLILLMAVVERVTGEPFEVFVQREVFAPLAMAGATYPVGGVALDAVPTEDVEDRGGVVRGLVHDENAHALGGVSGHAGLFATARDVLRSTFPYRGLAPGYLSGALATAAIQRAEVVSGSTRCLGWDSPAGPGGWWGATLPPRTFGHTGFTGTSVFCDPESQICVVLLTNRVHPTRVNARISPARAALHELVLESYDRL